MVLHRSCWLPPDGDARLLSFQHRVALLLDRPLWAAVPAHLPLSPDGTAAFRGPLRLSGWHGESGQPELEVWDPAGPVGLLVFHLPGWPPLTPAERAALPEPPPLVWTRGVAAQLTLRQERPPLGPLSWTWGPKRGWTAPSTA